MNELEAYELNELDNINGIGEEEKKRFKVTSPQTANWVFRKLNFVDRKIKEVEEIANEDILRIETWKKRETNRYKDLRAFFEGLINEYIINERKNDSKFNVNTPYGTAYIKSSGDKWIYDEEKLINWIEKNNPSLLKVEKSINKNELKKMAAVIENQAIDLKTGEIIQGVSIEQGESKVVISLK